MPLFRYKAVQASGAIVEGEAEGDDRRAVVARLQAGGVYPIEVEAAAAGTGASANRAPPAVAPARSRERAAAPGAASLFGRRLPMRDLVFFTRELGSLLGAGLPLDRALTALGGATSSARLRAVAARLCEAVRAGDSLSRACAREGGSFSRLYVTMVAAGEAGGDTEGALARLATLLERSRTVSASIGSALIYPAIVAGVGLVSALILVAYVLPRFEAMLRDLGRELPAATRWLLGLAGFLQDYGAGLLIGLAIACLVLAWNLRRPRFRLRFDAILLALPVLGAILRRIEAERFARVLASLLAAGVELPRALATVREVAGNRAVAEALAAVESDVRRGETVARSLDASGVMPPLVVELAQVGEQTGRLDGLLHKAAEILQRELELTLQRLVALVTPVTTILLGLMVASLILAMINAVLEIYDLGL